MPKITGRVSKLKEVLSLYARGLWVVPQWGRASVLDWQNYQLNEDDLRYYFADDKPNVAIALHKSMWIDVECDSDEATTQLDSLIGDVRTPTWKSRRGLHRLFLRPEGSPDLNKVMIGEIEVRGCSTTAGALTTLPPSNHPEDGTLYQWLPGLSLNDLDPIELPEVLVKKLKESGKKKRQIATVEEEGAIANGRRNDELYRYGCRVAVKEGIQVINDLLHGANKVRCKPPLSDTEVDGIVKSVENTLNRSKTSLSPILCGDWNQVIDAWKNALEWRPDMTEVLAVMLAVAASTSQVGDQQLFLQIIGSAGTAKTRFCDAMLTSSKCFLLEHLTGFHSGWNDGTGKDFSLISRINHQTLITPEGDVIMSSPRFGEIMSQQRRIFDGSSSAVYKNRDTEQKETGLRTPWIMAGTPMMLERNQAHLGDRFLKMMIDIPTEEMKQKIIRRAGHASWDAVNYESNCSPDSILTPEMKLAYQMTGGYIDWLRGNVTTKLRELDGKNRAEVVEQCAKLADFTAHMRSHPPTRLTSFDPEYEASVELPGRLEYQFIRLAKCLAVVYGKPAVDSDILRIIKRVAFDTGRGKVLTLCGLLHATGTKGCSVHFLGTKLLMSVEKVERWLTHMKRTGVADWRHDAGSTRWVLTPKMMKLYSDVKEGR